MNFMNLPDEYANENSYFRLMLAPCSTSLTLGRGTEEGPQEIVRASKHLEYYEEQFRQEPFLKGIQTLNKVLPKIYTSYDEVKQDLQFMVPSENHFTVVLGGDHSVSAAAVDVYAHKNISLIAFDACGGAKKIYEGDNENDVCIYDKLATQVNDITVVGVRTIEKEEYNKRSNNIAIHFDYEKDKEVFKKHIDTVNEEVYITVNCNVFSPSIMKNVNAIEPGGFEWYELLEYLAYCFEHKTVVGCTVVGFSPRIDYRGEAYMIAKLIHKIFALQCMSSSLSKK